MVIDALLVAKEQSVTNQNLIPFAGLTEFSAVVFHAYTFNNALLGNPELIIVSTWQ